MQLDTTQNACCASDNTNNSCSVPTNGQQGCDCASQATHTQSAVVLEKPFSIVETRQVIQARVPLNVSEKGAAHKNKGGVQRNIRGGVMLGIACITSPCCTPLIVPAILALLAGTPVALWLTQNVGWIYGGLTLVSALSLVLGLRWVWQKLTLPNPSEGQLSEITGENRVASTTIPLHEIAVRPALSGSIQPNKEK